MFADCRGHDLLDRPEQLPHLKIRVAKDNGNRVIVHSRMSFRMVTTMTYTFLHNVAFCCAVSVKENLEPFILFWKEVRAVHAIVVSACKSDPILVRHPCNSQSQAHGGASCMNFWYTVYNKTGCQVNKKGATKEKSDHIFSNFKYMQSGSTTRAWETPGS